MLFLVILLSFVPVPKLSGLYVAPINVALYAFILFALCNLPQVSKVLHKDTTALVLTFMVYVALDSMVGYFRDGVGFSDFDHIRKIILLFAILFATRNEGEYEKLFTMILAMIIINELFGLLDYFFGGPFETIRTWFVADDASAAMLGKGHRIAGFFNSIFSFSYVIAPAPIMIYTKYLTEKRPIWLLALFFSFLAIILNGERSALLMAAVCLVLLILFQSEMRVRNAILVLVVSALSIAAMLPLTRSVSGHLSSDRRTLIYRLQNPQAGEQVSGRILQQLAGMITIWKKPGLGPTEKDYQKEVHSLFSSFSSRGSIMRVDRYAGRELPAPHNHYINIGMHAGLPGILVFCLFIYFLIRICLQFNLHTLSNQRFHLYSLGTNLSLLAVLGNACFHNTGVFFAETTTWCLIGLVCAGKTLAVQDQAQATAPSRAAEPNLRPRLPLKI